MKIDPRTTSRQRSIERHAFNVSAMLVLKPLAIAVVMSLQTTVLLEQSLAQQPATSLPPGVSAPSLPPGASAPSLPPGASAPFQPPSASSPAPTSGGSNPGSSNSQVTTPALAPTGGTAAHQSKGSIQRLSGDRLQLNFRDADIEAVAAAFSQLLGRSILVDARVKGRMSLESPRPVSKEQALALFQTALRMQLFAMVQVGESLRVLPEVDAKLHGGPVQLSTSTLRNAEEVQTRVFRLRYELANNILPIIRPLVPPNNTISAMASNNSLIVTDYGSNLERIAQLIEDLDA